MKSSLVQQKKPNNKQLERLGILRFLTCGSVSDGKSTLLGRLLFEAKNVHEDQLESVITESRIYSILGKSIDLALLVDGLQAEREQGITIDVAYRFFETKKRKFIAADAPGHDQYTRNMVTAASNADAAIILVDAQKGILPQTKRHSLIVSMMGLTHVVVAVNKMDAVDFDKDVYDSIVSSYEIFAKNLDFKEITLVPISALKGLNVFTKATEMPWYDGNPLLFYLENLDCDKEEENAQFRLPIQWVNTPTPDFRGYCGNVAAGRLRLGDKVVSALTGQVGEVLEIISPNGKRSSVEAKTAVNITLPKQIDLSRGDILTHVDCKPFVANQFAANIIWMDIQNLQKGRPYTIKFLTAETGCQITDVSHKIDIDTLLPIAAKELALNEIGFCKIALDHRLAFDRYGDNRATGSFIIVDRVTNRTVGAGLVVHPLDRANNISWHDMSVDKSARQQKNRHNACAVWFTGLSGSGKSTIANALERKLFNLGYHSYILDGDNVRHGLNKDLGFTDADRIENIRRIAEVANLMVDAGLITIVSFISPFESERNFARKTIGEKNFFEIYVNTPLDICEKRDPKGLYAKARAGEIRNFTGVDSTYEPPKNPDLIINGHAESSETITNRILDMLVPHVKAKNST